MAETPIRTPLAIHTRRLTLFGRSSVLIAAVVLANVGCWIIAGLTFSQTDGLVNLAFLAWTLGLRHGLDADHISAIDNATRHLVSLDQLPVTCGLWFSLGHSTIVVLVNIAIAISVDIYDQLDSVGEIGGTVGTAISAAFLFLIALINIYFLGQAIRAKRRPITQPHVGDPSLSDEQRPVQGGGMLIRLIGPVLKAVDRPWKLYPVGLLFGLGFDTASSIALLAISAIAQRGPNGQAINHARIIILPFLFTAGMSFVDSLDSVLMLYAYASPSRFTPEGKIGFFQTFKAEGDQIEETDALLRSDDAVPAYAAIRDGSARTFDDTRITQAVDTKLHVMSSLSITLTTLSITVALSISVIEIMSLIGEKCQSCKEAAEAEDGGGLAGAWWRGWAYANDQSGLIGAAIVGTFIGILLVYHGSQWYTSPRRATRVPA